MPATQYAAPKLTDEQKSNVAILLKKFNNLILLSGLYKDKPVAFVCTTKVNGQAFDISPVFIVVTEDMKDDCKDAEGTPCGV